MSDFQQQALLWPSTDSNSVGLVMAALVLFESVLKTLEPVIAKLNFSGPFMHVTSSPSVSVQKYGNPFQIHKWYGGLQNLFRGRDIFECGSLTALLSPWIAARKFVTATSLNWKRIICILRDSVNQEDQQSSFSLSGKCMHCKQSIIRIPVQANH